MDESELRRTASRFRGAQASGESVTIETALATPGIYRLSPPYRKFSAFLWTIPEKQNFYVNDNYVTAFPVNEFSQERPVWHVAD